MNTDDLVIVRRTRYQDNQGSLLPLLTINTGIGKFSISLKAMNLIKLEPGDGLMFGFNMKGQYAFLFKEDEPDSFRVRKDGSSNLRFTSKDLNNYFHQCFELENLSKVRFDVKKDGDRFLLTQHN